MFGREEQLKHYQLVRERIAANAKPEYDRPLQLHRPPPPTARMRVPSVVEIDRARQMAAVHVPQHLDAKTQVDTIIRKVCDKHRVLKAEVLGKRRTTTIANARMEIYWRLKTELNWPNTRIAKLMNRDHSSVQHAIEKIRKEKCL